jgi:hypothetical protein
MASVSSASSPGSASNTRSATAACIHATLAAASPEQIPPSSHFAFNDAMRCAFSSHAEIDRCGRCVTHQSFALPANQDHVALDSTIDESYPIKASDMSTFKSCARRVGFLLANGVFCFTCVVPHCPCEAVLSSLNCVPLLVRECARNVSDGHVSPVGQHHHACPNADNADGSAPLS